jgi:hypothetical protein
MKSGMMRWVGHVARMGTKHANKMLVAKSEGKRTRNNWA